MLRLNDLGRPFFGGVREYERPRSSALRGGLLDREREEYDDPVYEE